MYELEIHWLIVDFLKLYTSVCHRSYSNFNGSNLVHTLLIALLNVDCMHVRHCGP